MREPHEPYRSKSLVGHGPDRLEVVPSFRACATDALYGAIGATMTLLSAYLFLLWAMFGLTSLTRDPLGTLCFGGLLFIGALVGMVLTAGVWIGYRARVRVVLDRAAGTLTERRGKKVRTFPLSEVARVTLGRGGPYRDESVGPLSTATVTYETAILTVHLRDGKHLVLSNHADLDWSRRAARRIADFLQVAGPNDYTT